MSSGSSAIAPLGLALSVNLTVVTIGFLCSRFKIVPMDCKKGIGALVATVALPAALFNGTSNLDPNMLDLKVILCLFIVKFLIFGSTAAAGIAKDRGKPIYCT